ncbi:MAG: sugar ABC transporter permease [Treponema sp.]|jgi:raffinose/stachyose/melibiose transport system permease protein|nr:sugar ABC transporter permease [Treponema sp.]
MLAEKMKNKSIYVRWFWPFVIPALVFFTAVIVLPFMVGVFNSFTVWRGSYYFNPLTKTRAQSVFEALNGLSNYSNALKDARFIQALWYTVRYTLIAVVVINGVSLSLALLINKMSAAIAGVFRTVFFLPNMLGGLALGYIFQFIFQVVFTDMLFSPQGIIPMEALRYMTQHSLKALFALVILTTWQSSGYMMLIYIAGLNTIPKDYYEAASIDGSSWWHTFWNITLPMLMPSFTVVLFTTLSSSFKLLDQNVALTDGNFNTRMLAYQILRTIRDSNPADYGKAQAQAVLFFILVAAITLTQVYLTKKKEIEA